MKARNWFAAAMMAGIAMSGGLAAAAETAATYMIEVLPLKTGVTAEAAGKYFTDVSPIIASHGIFPVQGYRVIDPQKSMNAVVVNVWRVSDPHGFDRIFKDPEYLKHVKTRDAIFDLPNRVGYMTQELY